MQPYQQPPPYAPPQPPNPYAPPAAAPLYRANMFIPQGEVAGPVPQPTLRKAKLGIGIAQLVTGFFGLIGLVLGGIMSDGDSDVASVFFVLGGISFGVWYLLIFATAIVNGLWIYRFWSWIPPEQRHTPMWKKYISPGSAVGFMFVPYFQFYWMFVVYLGIPDILERMRVQFPSSKGSAKNLGIGAAITPLVFFPAAPFVGYFFAKHVEEMAIEMTAQMRGAPRPY